MVHPLSPEGLAKYDFALQDSLDLRPTPRRSACTRWQVRPKSFAEPLVVGTLYLDVATAELVRFRFSFTPAAYLDPELEDISIVLENALLREATGCPTARKSRSGAGPRGSTSRRAASSAAAGRSATTIFNPDLPPATFPGRPIGGSTQPRRRRPRLGPARSRTPSPAWPAPVNRQDMDAASRRRSSGSRATGR